MRDRLVPEILLPVGAGNKVRGVATIFLLAEIFQFGARMRRVLNVCSIMALLCLPSSAEAWKFSESFQMHGFVSQGYLDNSANNFIALDSRTGSFDLTEVGVNANLALTDDIRAGAQVILRNVGDFTEDAPQIDWALLDYQPRDELGVRLGKVKMPMGLYNETRDSDFLRHMIFLPQSIYDDTRRDVYLAYLGAGLYGNIPAGSWGDVDYHFFGGEICFPNKSVLAANSERSLRSTIAKNNAAASPNPAIPASFLSLDRKNDKLYGGSLIFNYAGGDLRLGASIFHEENSLYLNDLPTPASEAVIHHKYVLSLEYTWHDWLLATEYSEMDRTQTTFGVVTLDGPTQSWYVMLSYHLDEKWTATALYDEFYRLKNDKDGGCLLQAENYTAWRKDFGLGLRYDFTENLNAKAEYHWIDGAAQQLSLFNPDGLARYWNYFAAKISYSF